VALFSRSRTTEPTSDEHELQALAERLQLDFRSGRNFVSLFGEIDGHRVSADANGPSLRVKVKFDSGMHDLSIRQSDSGIRTNRVDVDTGDAEFDAVFRLLLDTRDHPRAVLDYLNPYRRQIIRQLGQAFKVHEIEEDELDIRLQHKPTVAEIAHAIDWGVHAAKALSMGAPPQDVRH